MLLLVLLFLASAATMDLDQAEFYNSNALLSSHAACEI